MLDPSLLRGDAVRALCRQHGIKRLSLFGSALRDDFGKASDVDILVEFGPGRTPGLTFFAIEQELEAILGVKVDLNTPACLSPYFRDKVMAEARTIYDRS